MGAIGFFAPLPIALMIPFMGAQSAVMGEAFGKHFQYGKRKISAMSNEDFNKLTSAELFDDTLHGFSQIIPKLQESMRRTEDLQSFVIEQLVRYVRSLPDDIISGLTSGPVSESPLIQNLEGNITGGVDIANQIAAFMAKILPSVPKAHADPIPAHKPIVVPSSQPIISTAQGASPQETLAAVVKIAQAQKAPSFVGPVRPGTRGGESQANRLTIHKDGSLTNLDTRKVQPPIKLLPRAPKQLHTVIAKWQEEKIALGNRIRALPKSSRRLAMTNNFNGQISKINKKIKALRLRYDFNR